MTQTATVLHLNDLIDQYHEITAMIIEAGGELTPEIEAMLSESAVGIGQKLDGYTGYIGYLKGQVEYLKAEAEQYTSRAKTLSNTVDGLRERMVFAMQSIGEDKVKTAKHSYSLRTTESWKIDEDLFSNGDLDELVSEGLAERTYKVDMKGIKDIHKNTLRDELPEYLIVTEKTSITVK